MQAVVVIAPAGSFSEALQAPTCVEMQKLVVVGVPITLTVGSAEL